MRITGLGNLGNRVLEDLPERSRTRDGVPGLICPGVRLSQFEHFIIALAFVSAFARLARNRFPTTTVGTPASVRLS